MKEKKELIKSLLYGLIVLIIGVWFAFYIIGNPINEFRLITQGITTHGRITQADEDINENETGNRYSFVYEYAFNLPDGREIKAVGRGNGKLPMELLDLSTPYPIKVVYLKNNPAINKNKDALCGSITEFLWRKAGLGLLLLSLFSSIGIYVIKKGIQEFKKLE